MIWISTQSWKRLTKNTSKALPKAKKPSASANLNRRFPARQNLTADKRSSTARNQYAETRKPVIIAPDYTDDELYEWMHQKIKAAQDLKWANEARAKQAENLSALEQDITNLEKAAALSIARMITYPR